jgi:hypothetical protein
MAITDTEPKTERSSEPEEGQERERPPEGERDRDDTQAESAEGSGGPQEETEDPEQAKEAEKKNRTKGIAGGVGIFLVLAIYFVWIGNEMGSHALSGTFEMWAIFGAIFLGVAALVAGGAISRKRND